MRTQTFMMLPPHNWQAMQQPKKKKQPFWKKPLPTKPQPLTLQLLAQTLVEVAEHDHESDIFVIRMTPDAYAALKKAAIPPLNPPPLNQ